MARQSTSGSTLSQEVIHYVEVNRDRVDDMRFGTMTIKVVNGILDGWVWEEKERRGKEIDYL